MTERPAGGRLFAHYLTDLIASVAVVLVLGWLIQASASDDYLRNAVIAQNDIYVSISRFTPHNLASSYVSTVAHMNRNVGLGNEFGEEYLDAIHDALITVGMIILNVCRAVPDTILDLYDETAGTAAWIVLAGFGVAIGSVFAALLGRRTSVWRLILATAVSPLAISVLFLALQGFMVAMLDTFYWFTSLAPYTVACPVMCTLYWVTFPHAERGATATVAHTLLRILEPEGSRPIRR